MKKLAFIATLIFAMSCGACKKVGPEVTPEEPQEQGFVAKSWNGYFVEEMAKAYEYFVENDKLPASINIEGLDYGKGKMVAAGYMLVQKMIDEPETWQDTEVEFNDKFSCPDNEKNNTITVDSISLADFMSYAKRAYDYAGNTKIFPNYVTMQSGYVDADGSKYDVKIVINALSVGLTRIFHYYKENNKLPEYVSTWHTDYLRKVSNCQIDDPVVISTMESIVSGKTTDREKAEAIFAYARDEWSYEGYSNTKYGAVKVIQGKQGNCCDMSHAIVALCRAAGIPARYLHAQCQYSSGNIGHVMAQIYVDGQWFLVDATNNGNTFGNHESWKHMNTFNGLYNQLPF